MTKYYFVAYTKDIQGIPQPCNDTTKEHPVKWIMDKCHKIPKYLYNLIFYKEITWKEYIIFHPEESNEICENCAGRNHPAGEYCEGCPLKKYRK